MPAFMCISGMLFRISARKYSSKELVRRKLTDIGVPLVFWTWIMYMISCLQTEEKLISYKYLIFATKNLWFLWSVLYCSFFCLLINRMFSDNVIVYIVCIASFFVIPDYFNFINLKMMFPYFLIGYFYSTYFFEGKIKSYCLGVISLFFLLIIIVFYHVDDLGVWQCYSLENMKNIVHVMKKWSVGISGSWIFINLVKKCEKVIPEFVVELGKKSIGIYIISGIIYAYVIPACTYSVNTTMPIQAVYDFTLTIIILLGSYSIVQIMNKTGIGKIVFGNR